MEDNDNETANTSFQNSSFISSPAFEDVNRRISLSRKSFDGRKSLKSFLPNDNDGPSDDRSDQLLPQEFSVTLNSLHEINSRSFNPNRAFNYDFINFIDSFINKDKIDFKMVAQSLDAGTKIYISKVGLVYNNTQKICSSLSMATEELQYGEDGFLEDKYSPQSQKRRKKKKKNIQTIASNVETLNSKFETNIEIDPLFYHLSEAFDVGNVNFLLMANLNANPHGRMLLDWKENLNFDLLPNMENSLVDFPLLKPDYLFQDNYVCRDFSNFEFLKRDVEVNIEEFITQNNSTKIDINFDFDLNADVEDIHEPAAFDFDNLNSPDVSDFEDNENLMNDSNSESLPMTKDNILNFLPKDDENNQFFDRFFLQQTFKNTLKYGYSKSKKNSEPVKKKRKRKCFTENEYDIKNVTPEKFKKDKSTIYSATAIEKWQVMANQKRMADVLIGYSNKSRLRCCMTRNLEFSQLFSNKKPRSVTEDSDHYDMDGDFHDGGEEFVRDDQSDIGTSNLIDGPLNLDTYTDKLETQPVDALDIDYAKVAKKIDIKKVKSGMWDVIRKETTEKMNLSSGTSSDSQGSLTFLELRADLPNLLSSNLNDNLSTPISFVALLHLCNEKNLTLKNGQELGDFFIDASST